MLGFEILTNGPVPLEQTLTSTIALAFLDAMAVGALLAVIVTFAETRLLAAPDVAKSDRPHRPSFWSQAKSILSGRGVPDGLAPRVDTKAQ